MGPTMTRTYDPDVYRAAREHGWTARTALYVARTATSALGRAMRAAHRWGVDPSDVVTLHGPAGLTVRVRVDYDGEPRGLFTDTWSPAAIQNPDWRPDMPGYGSVFRYYVPESGESVRERAEGLRRYLGRHDAWTTAREWALSECRTDRNGDYYGVTATVYVAGESVSDASIWGVSVSEGFAWSDLADVATELVAETLAGVDADAVAAQAARLAVLADVARRGVTVADLAPDPR